MTVRFLTSWNGYQAGDRATLSNEAALIAGGIARADYTQDGPLLGVSKNMGWSEDRTAPLDYETGLNSGILRSSKLNQAMRRLRVGIPSSMVFYGDSTGNATDEWVYLLSGYIGAAFLDFTIDYRVWNNGTQQYDQPTTLQTGTDGKRYITTGAGTTPWRVLISDTAATSITGDIDVRVKLSCNGSLPNSTMYMASKYGAAGQRSWYFALKTTGALEFSHSADGTNMITRNSTANLSGAQLTDAIWVRATLDVDNGATGNTCTFYTSADDGATWSALGTASTLAATTSIFDSTAATQFLGVGSSSMTQQDHDFDFYEMEVYGSLTGATRVADIDMGAIFWNVGSTTVSFTDDVGNAAVLYTAASNGSFTGAPRLAIYNGSTPGAAISYAHDGTRYPKLTIGSPLAAFISFSHNEGNDVAYRADYKTLTDLLVATNPDMAICAVLQNPRISPASDINAHALRLQQVSEFAASQGFDVMDVYSTWLDAYTDTDGVHPVAAGSQHWANVARATLGV